MTLECCGASECLWTPHFVQVGVGRWQWVYSKGWTLAVDHMYVRYGYTLHDTLHISVTVGVSWV